MCICPRWHLGASCGYSKLSRRDFELEDDESEYEESWSSLSDLSVSEELNVSELDSVVGITVLVPPYGR